LNRAIEYRMKEIENEFDLHVQGNEMDLINSRFVKEPFAKIERSLVAYDFFPV
jgi:hypothetical protein